MADYAKIYAVRLLRTDKNTGQVTPDTVVNKIAFAQSSSYYDSADDMIELFKAMKLPPGVMLEMVESHIFVMHDGSPESVSGALIAKGWGWLDHHVSMRPKNWFTYDSGIAEGQNLVITDKDQIHRIKNFIWKEIDDFYYVEETDQRRKLNDMRRCTSTVIPLEWWE